MSETPAPTCSLLRVRVDPRNPGQYFACCGLLELADRLWKGATGWFADGQFCITPIRQGGPSVTSRSLLLAARNVSIDQLDADDHTSSAMWLGAPFQLRLDWWKDTRSGGNRLKVWAGSMRPVRIARAMQAALSEAALLDEALFDYSAVVFDPEETSKKVEPYYFDSRRGANATSRDIGFAPDALQMTTMAFPAVEFFCLVGLQRCQPMALSQPARMFEYHTWEMPCRPAILPTAVCGLLTRQAGSRFRFQNAFRTDQKKHKAFLPADLIGDSR